MIYLDAAATSFQKPASVRRAVLDAMTHATSPGRGAHPTAARAAAAVYACRDRAARLFSVPEPERVVFTMNATHGLNIAIRTLVRPWDPVVISGYEHNAVTRPLHALGAKLRVASGRLFDPDAVLEDFRKRLPGAKCAVATHVSNVFGFVLPVREIAALCRAQGVPLIVDASQSAGVLDVDVSALGAAFVAMPGHKGLLGPQGTGLLLCGTEPEPLIFGGTGSQSLEQTMPDDLPDRLEAGTHNVPGIAGLDEGIRYVAPRMTAIRAQERALTAELAERLRGCEDLEVFYSGGEAQTGVLSVRSARQNCEMLAETLAENGVAVRAGLHCAPLAHRSAGTLETGTVRLSLSPFTTQREIERVAALFQRITRQ
ncbi:MAG: aminotransferase class V-fold PLP-dependent enzyme [Oscillospiraceae bacterium]|nr:aminotransferase class V-fold PLP-dependent enzyme [Oscillospiraceae bacterium]